MVSTAFDYVRVTDYDGAVSALAEYGEDAKILAWGQSLVPMVNLRLARPSVLIDINDVDDDRTVSVQGPSLHLPALTRHHTLLRSPLVKESCPLLSSAATEFGNVRGRTRGTIGDGLAHADPTAELALCALTRDATIVIRGPRGERRRRRLLRHLPHHGGGRGRGRDGRYFPRRPRLQGWASRNWLDGPPTSPWWRWPRRSKDSSV